MGKNFTALFCCGSRPELIKISPVYHKMRGEAKITPLLCTTGQHRDILTAHLDCLNIKPDFALDVMRAGQSLDHLMDQLFARLPDMFDQAQPDMVIIQGDTASAFASAMIASRKGLPLAHIEAGLRTHDLTSPFPEEIYRQNISALATWHFCPTERSRHNLLREGRAPESIFVTGNTSVDMVMAIEQKQEIRPVNGKNPYFLITLHRRESQGAPLREIIGSLGEFAIRQPQFDFIIPLHPNPATSNMIRDRLGGQQNISLIAPLPYPQFVRLMAGAFAIITDSGGIQEEAPALNIPVIVVRDVTERAEGLDSGCLRLAGTRKQGILRELTLLVEDDTHYNRICRAENPFGDGRAADRIVAHLQQIMEREYQAYGGI